MLMPGLSSTATDSARVSWPNATPTFLMRAGSRVDTSPGGEAGGGHRIVEASWRPVRHLAQTVEPSVIIGPGILRRSIV